MITVSIIGGGNVAFHLATALNNASGVKLQQLYNRSEFADGFHQLSTPLVHSLKDLDAADIFIIAVADDAIRQVSLELPFKDQLVVHTSGSVPMDSLGDQNRKGVFYALQSFSMNRRIPFDQIPLCLEAENPEDLQLLKELGAKITPLRYHVNSTQRAALHLSAVFVNNFVNHLYFIGQELCETHQVSFDVLKPLIKETAQKITEMTPFDAQTGPARRNDKNTIDKQLTLSLIHI